MVEIVFPHKAVTVEFALEPVFNATTSLVVLGMAEQFTGFPDWVYETVKTLSSEQLCTNEIVLLDTPAHLVGGPWDSYLDWVEDLSARDATVLRDQALNAQLKNASDVTGDAVPEPDELLGDRARYLDFAARVGRLGGDDQVDMDLWEREHDLLVDPEARQGLIVAHLLAMWDEVLAPEWQRNLPMLKESVAAFQSLNLEGLSAHEVVSRVILRDMPSSLRVDWLDDAEHIKLIPSAHCGPYLFRLGGECRGSERLVFGARVPQDSAVSSPALGRSELLMRLNALTNDSRLRIIELLADRGELSTPDITEHLGLSQSAGSRHLEHLAAAGYVTVRRPKATKLYRLNPERVDETFEALKRFLGQQ